MRNGKAVEPLGLFDFEAPEKAAYDRGRFGMGQDELCELAKTELTCQAGGLLNRTGGIIVVAGMDFSGFDGPVVATIWVAAYPNVLACNRFARR